MEKDVVKDLFKKNNAVIFFDYFVLYAKTIIFSPLSLFLGVWLNIFIMVSWFAFKQGDSFLLSSIVATGVIRNGMYTFLRSLLNIKRVGANDRLRLVPTNRAIEVSAALTWNFIYNLGSTIIFIGIALIFIPTQRVMFENINWLMYVSGYLLLWLSSVLTAYLLYIGFKNPENSQAVAIIMYVIAYTFFGCAFPFASVAKFGWLDIILYIFPQRYAINILQAGWVNATSMRYTNLEWSEKVDWGFGGRLWLPYVISFCVLALLAFGLIMFYMKKNKWHKKDQYGNLIHKRGSQYIKLIKSATSIEELDKIRNDYMLQRESDINTLKGKTTKANKTAKVGRTKNK
jgi:ABC-2 type transport system permease protein